LRIPRLPVATAALVAVAAFAPAVAQAKLPSTANPTFTPGVGIGGVNLGSRIATAKAAWGRPTMSGDYNASYSDARNGQLGSGDMNFEDGPRGRVTNVRISLGFDTRSGKYDFRSPLTAFESSRGITLGSSLRAVKAAYPAWRTQRGYETAFLSLIGARRVQTIFQFAGKRLYSITIQDGRLRG
jgi:hypothetical protein